MEAGRGLADMARVAGEHASGAADVRRLLGKGHDDDEWRRQSTEHSAADVPPARYVDALWLPS